MNLWAENCPDNFPHKYLLVAAEIARVSGEYFAAIDLYEDAIIAAKEYGFIQHEALANELAAKFWLNKNKETIAKIYLNQAYYCYARWGAKAKIDDLENTYPQFLAPLKQAQNYQLNLNDTFHQTIDKSSLLQQTIQTIHSSSSISEALDFATILKASQALSSEIKLDQLLSTLTRVVREHPNFARIPHPNR